MKYYRFVVGKQGIYEVVYQIDPKRNDPKRINKPDGSWLPRIGENHPGAISLWTEYGLKKYNNSGLMNWHIEFVQQPVQVLIATIPRKILYKDKYQILCYPKDIEIIQKISPKDLNL